MEEKKFQTAKEIAPAGATDCPGSGNNLPQAGQNEKMTSEQLHQQLAENTKQMNDEREAYAQKLIQLKRDRDEQIELSIKQAFDLQTARDAFEATITAKKMEFHQKESNIAKFRRKATETYLSEVAKAKGDHARINEQIQCERHNIFEQYKFGGGGSSQELLANCFIPVGSECRTSKMMEE